MPGGEDSYDLIRTKDERSNSKSDTFSINPRRLGTTDHQVQQIALQTLSGDLTNGNAIDSLTGDGLQFNSGTLETNVKEGTVREVFGQDSSVLEDVELLEFGDRFAVSTTIIDNAIIEFDTPYTDLSLLFGSPVAAGDTLEVGDITDGNRTVYDASTDTVGDGTTAADHASADSDTYQIDGTTVAEEDGNADLVIKNIDEAGIARLASALDVDGNDITDSGTTVYDASADTVGDGTTDANHSSVSADDVNIGGNGFVSTGDVFANGRLLAALDADAQSTSSTSYVSLSQNVVPIQWGLWVPSGATAVVGIEVNNADADFRLRNITDGETIYEQTSDASNTSQPIQYTPSTTNVPIRAEWEFKSPDGNSAFLNDAVAYAGVQL